MDERRPGMITLESPYATVSKKCLPNGGKTAVTLSWFIEWSVVRPLLLMRSRRDLRIYFPLFLAVNDMEEGIINSRECNHLTPAGGIIQRADSGPGQFRSLFKFLGRTGYERWTVEPRLIVLASTRHIDIRILAIAAKVDAISSSLSLDETEVFRKFAEFLQVGMFEVDVSQALQLHFRRIVRNGWN